LKDFRLRQTVIADRFMFDILISKHLAAFHLAAPAKAMLPIEKTRGGGWVAVSRASITSAGEAASSAFKQVFKALGASIGPDEFFAGLDSQRHKLSSQSIPQVGWLVFQGAGGGRVCAAYSEATVFATNKLVIDQTLYWASVNTEDEAVYLTGLLNSEAINQVIKEFQPRGQFGERHVHKLAIGVTPKYNPQDPEHVDVVAKTKLVQGQLAIAMTNPALTKYLDPNVTLAIRRRKIREAILALSSNTDFEQACRAVYGI